MDRREQELLIKEYNECVSKLDYAKRQLWNDEITEKSAVLDELWYLIHCIFKLDVELVNDDVHGYKVLMLKDKK